MDSRAGSADRFDRGVVHLSDTVRERASGVDDALGLNRPRLVRKGVLQEGNGICQQAIPLAVQLNARLTLTLAPAQTSLPVLSFFFSNSVTSM